MATSNWDWIFHTLGWTLAGIGLLLALWAFFWDRSRGRRRCPKCWYSMEGAVEDEVGSLKCPECGRSPRTSRALLRTRRRKRWAIFAAALIVAAWPLGSYPKASRAGWASILPARLVIELVPIGGADGPFGRDVRIRLGLVADNTGKTNVTISPRDENYLIRRIARGNIFARPISARWRASYGEVRRQDGGIVFRFGSDRFPMTYRDGTPSDDARHAALLELLTIPTETHARTRDRWPRDLPVHFEAEPINWWPSDAQHRSNVQWTTRDGTQTGEESGFRSYCALDPFDQSAVELDVKVTHLLRLYGSDRDDILASETSRHTISWTTVDSIEEAMTPVRSDEIDAHLASAFVATFDRRISLNPTGLDPTIVGDLSFGVRAEIWLDDERLCWFNARWIGSTYPLSQNGTDWQIEGGWEAADAYVAAHKDDGQWTLRLKTDPAWALYNLDADTYWDGEITIPLTIK